MRERLLLAYVGGVERYGNVLALHRPYLPKEAAGTLSDVEYESAEKDVMVRVREYLKSMEVDQFFIDKMMSTSSKDSTSGATPAGRHARERGLAKLIAGKDCEQKVLNDIRGQAFKRQLAALAVSTESYTREIEALTVPGPEPALTPERALLRGLFQKGMEALARDDKTEASRWFHKAADAGGVDAIKAIGRFYEGLDTAEAVHWYEEAARRGDAEAMSALGGMYYYGFVAGGQNCVTARYWYEKAAAAGDDDAKDRLDPGDLFSEHCPKTGMITRPKPNADEFFGPPPKQ